MKKFYLALAVAGALLLAVLGLARCHEPVPPAPDPAASPMPAATAIASSSTAATVASDLEIIIPRSQVTTPQSSVYRHAEDSRPAQVITPDEPIVIRLKQTATAAASSEASASVSEQNPLNREQGSGSREHHARLGVFMGTVPGAIALTYQVAGFEIPAGVLGTRLGIGLEVEGNAQQLGAGVSLGKKAFGTVGGYVGWTGPGWYLGVGLRF